MKCGNCGGSGFNYGDYWSLEGACEFCDGSGDTELFGDRLGRNERRIVRIIKMSPDEERPARARQPFQNLVDGCVGTPLRAGRGAPLPETVSRRPLGGIAVVDGGRDARFEGVEAPVQPELLRGAESADERPGVPALCLQNRCEGRMSFG